MLGKSVVIPKTSIFQDVLGKLCQNGEGETLERIALNSTALTWICYLSEQRILQVGLRNGKNYDYFDVPLCTYRAFLAAASKGRYYNSHIRNEFRFQKVQRHQAASDN